MIKLDDEINDKMFSNKDNQSVTNDVCFNDSNDQNLNRKNLKRTSTKKLKIKHESDDHQNDNNSNNDNNNDSFTNEEVGNFDTMKKYPNKANNYKYIWCINENLNYDRFKQRINFKDKLLKLHNHLYLKHKWNSLIQLQHSFIVDRRLSTNLLMKNFLFSLYINYNGDDNVRRHVMTNEKLDYITKFIWKLIYLLDERYETLIELVQFFIKICDFNRNNLKLLNEYKLFHERLVKEYDRRLQKHGDKKTRYNMLTRSCKMLRIIFSIYNEYFDFYEFKCNYNKKSKHSSSSLSKMNANLIRIEKLKTNFTNIIDYLIHLRQQEQELSVGNDNEILSNKINLDILPLIMLELLINYDRKNFKESYEMLRKYTEIDPNNLNGYVYLYEFIVKFIDNNNNNMIIDNNFNNNNDDYYDIKYNCLKNIIQLCPDSKYVINYLHLIINNENHNNNDEMMINCIEICCNYLDYNHNFNSLKAWKLLYEILMRLFDNINYNNSYRNNNDDQIKLTKLREYFYQKFYYWQYLHFRNDQLNDFLKKLENYHNNNAGKLKIELYRCKGKIIDIIHRQFAELINLDYTNLIYFKVTTTHL